MIHLSQIVVVGGKPENRNSVNSRGSRFTGKFHRAESFVEGERGSAEESDLLSRNDGGRSLTHAVQIGERLFRGAPGAVLPLENIGHLLAARRFVGNLSRFLFQPLMKIRGSRIKASNLGSVSQEILEKARGMRDLREWDTVGLHRQRS